MKKITRRCAAAAVAVVTALTIPAMAADSADRATPGSAARERDVYEGDDLLQVILPMNTDHVFDFIMDPQKLIEKTEAAAYDGDRFEEGATLFFRRSDGKADKEYSSSSDALTIVNKGSLPVEVTLDARLLAESVHGLTISDDREFGEDTGPALYLALTDGAQTVPIDLTEGASITAVVKGEYSFWLTGAVNENGDWSEMNEAEPKVTVTWKVSPWDGETVGEKSDRAGMANGAAAPNGTATPDGAGKPNSVETPNGTDTPNSQKAPGGQEASEAVSTPGNGGRG